ncbi:hypothetical protein ES703_44125 [subsurface metagenome]
MAARTTRNKLRFQAEKAIEELDRSLRHIQTLDLISEKRSPYINGNIPKLVLLYEQFKQTLIAFREGL